MKPTKRLSPRALLRLQDFKAGRRKFPPAPAPANAVPRRKRDPAQTLAEFRQWADALPAEQRDTVLGAMADRMDAIARRHGLGAPIDRGEHAAGEGGRAEHAKAH
jgi:hypothetical protein